VIPPSDIRWLDRLAPPGEREALARRRSEGEPLQYVLGRWAFRSLELIVDSRALIPRPETEQVVEVAFGEIAGRRHPVVVDLGTGTGAIALAAATELHEAQVWGTDVDADALALATENRNQLGAAVLFAQGSWFEALPGHLRGWIDLVVSNPPYVSEEEWPELDPEVRREPYGALVAESGSDGTPGLCAVESVLRAAPEWLAEGGAIVVEMAPHQARAAVAVAHSVGLSQVRVVQDLAGRDRAVVARSERRSRWHAG